MLNKKGLFIVFEGIDGCGKSTALWNFSKYLASNDKHIHLLVTREPYKARQIREILKQETDPYSEKEKLTQLFIDDRKEHILNLIWPSLNQKVNVISDRYKYSTLAYQFAQGIPIEKLINLHQNLLIPDIIFIIDLPVEISIQRMKKAINTENRDKEHKFESSVDFLNKVRNNFLMLPKILPNENIIIINGNQSIEQVNQEIINKFSEFLNKEN